MGDKRVEEIGRKAIEKREGFKAAARSGKAMGAHERTENAAHEAHEQPFKQGQREVNAGETDKGAELTMHNLKGGTGVGAMKQGAMGKMHSSPQDGHAHMAEHHRHMAEYHKHMAVGAGDISGGDAAAGQ
jgi:hypothetical protein